MKKDINTQPKYLQWPSVAQNQLLPLGWMKCPPPTNIWVSKERWAVTAFFMGLFANIYPEIVMETNSINSIINWFTEVRRKIRIVEFIQSNVFLNFLSVLWGGFPGDLD